MAKYIIHSYYHSFKKRFFDIILSVSGILFIIPFLAIIYPLFIFLIGKPFIFKQKRMGKDKVPFTIYKIRTMKNGSEKQQSKYRKLSTAPYPMFKVNDDPRFIKFGKIISKLGIDEAPQLLNILKGEMSFVGPRPLPLDEAKKLPAEWNFRYLVRPGILSKWAISKNRYKSLQAWKKLELETIKHGSSILDLKLIFQSINLIILKKFF
ncbi:sugar transferase [Candidatus Woesebacteria bacterium]|nr:sugar transferase [Candidatus Woesebacteria bacterium]